MKPSRATFYAFVALTRLARGGGDGPVSSATLAKEGGVPARFLLKVMRRLVTAGIVSSSKGPAGGYRLSRSPGKITILDVIEAVEGDLEPGFTAMPAPLRDNPLAPRLVKVYRMAAFGVKSGFAGFTLAELAGVVEPKKE